MKLTVSRKSEENNQPNKKYEEWIGQYSLLICTFAEQKKLNV